jgi:hypothetical protein
MERTSNPYSHDPYAEDEAFARARWAALSADEQTAFLVKIGILTPDLKLHPNYDHRPEAGSQADSR